MSTVQEEFHIQSGGIVQSQHKTNCDISRVE